MKHIAPILLLIISYSCSASLTASYKSLPPAEKRWVFWHPFKAKKAYKISLEAERTKDSLKKTNSIGTDNNGGNIDAFKHALWMAKLTQEIGKNAATSLGNLHEKGNYQTFKKRQFEDGLLPDKPSEIMDLYNNKIGVSIGEQNKNASKATLINIVLDSLKHGKLRVLLKDKNGTFLDCDKKKIPTDSLKHKWNNSKCIVPSSY